jgi:hypothetical protein
MKYKRVIYWISTGLVFLFVGIGSFADLFKIEAVRDSFKHISFPEYMLPFFGVAKLAGSITIMMNSPKILSEWAYAGIVFYFVGASYIHLIVGDGLDKIGITLFMLTITFSSYRFSGARQGVSD